MKHLRTGTTSGPLFAAQIDINIPDDNVSALIETFNYQRND